MDIQEVKKAIDDKQFNIDHLVFKYEDTPFLAEQYIHQIAVDTGKTINKVDSVEEICRYSDTSFFPDSSSDQIMLYVTEELKGVYDNQLLPGMVFIITKKVTDCGIEVVNCPKLLDWQIKDYTYSLAEGVDTKKLDNLVQMCNNNIYRLEQELKKLALFSKEERPFLFDEMTAEGMFSDISSQTIFDFSNAVLKRDLNTLKELYKEIELIDCEPLALLNILWKQFRNIILVQLNPNPSEVNTGLSSKQIWAIKNYNCGFYTKEELIRNFELLTSIDKRIKTGIMPMDNRGATFMRDYLTTQILIGR